MNLSHTNRSTARLFAGTGRARRASVAKLAHLSKMTKRWWVRLSNAKVTDAGLKRLSRLPEIRKINLVATDVTAAGVLRFRHIHPRCKIEH